MNKEDKLLQSSNMSIQDRFLNQVRKEGIFVTVHLVNGFQIRGTVKSFDNFTVLMDSDGKQMLIYKNAISTITPQRAVTINQAAQSDEAQGSSEDQ
jgi:host factor-I protein